MEKVLSLSLEESNFTTAPPATGATPVSTLPFIVKYALLNAKKNDEVGCPRSRRVCVTSIFVSL